MKHIKAYNESNEYYTEIYDGDININNNSISSFTDIEVSDITKAIGDKYTLESFDSNMLLRYILDKYWVAHRQSKNLIDITKYKDEWYSVEIYYEDNDVYCFKCDQFSGLLKLIEDKI